MQGRKGLRALATPPVPVVRTLQTEVYFKLIARQKLGGPTAMRTLSRDGVRESTFRVLSDGKVTMELCERIPIPADGERPASVLMRMRSEPTDPCSVILMIDIAVLDGDWWVDVDRAIFLH